ncbi:MAG TPA: MFS transporter [Patescibacteria group bacterium]|nr:MFS transporter [Patescibacteria group bacterium]
MPLLGSRAVFTPTLLACYGITAAVHVASIVLNTLLPFHVVDLGGTKTQVGLLFSVMTMVSMFLRPTVGGWVDRFGARPVIAPGIAALVLTSLALQLATTPVAVIILMVGLGIANGLITTPASVLTALSSPAKHRGEALGTYYLAGSLGIAIGPPLAFGLRAVGGMRLAFAVVVAFALVLAVIVARLPANVAGPAAAGPRRLRLISRSALAVSFALVLSTIGHSSVFAFLPLYAVGQGQTAALAWFFVIYPVWLITWRALLRGVSDRLGHLRVSVLAMSMLAVAYLVLALPPTTPSLALAALVLASGNAVLYPTLAALVVERAPEAERGLALGTLSGAWDLGVVVGSVLIGAIADRVSYGAGFAVGAGFAALGVGALGIGVGGPEMAPHTPPTLAAPRQSRGAPR